MADVKRPTAQDIEAARKMATCALERAVMGCIEHPGMGPRSLILNATMWEPVFRVLDYAADCLRAEEEGERVPEVDPESSVRAMSDEEVEVALTERGVEGWAFSRRCYGWPISDDGRLEVVQVAIDELGQCWTRDCGDGSVGGRFDDVTGDTTTPEGRAECSRRLLVYMLREEAP